MGRLMALTCALAALLGGCGAYLKEVRPTLESLQLASKKLDDAGIELQKIEQRALTEGRWQSYEADIQTVTRLLQAVEKEVASARRRWRMLDGDDAPPLSPENEAVTLHTKIGEALYLMSTTSDDPRLVLPATDRVVLVDTKDRTWLKDRESIRGTLEEHFPDPVGGEKPALVDEPDDTDDPMWVPPQWLPGYLTLAHLVLEAHRKRTEKEGSVDVVTLAKPYRSGGMLVRELRRDRLSTSQYLRRTMDTLKTREAQIKQRLDAIIGFYKAKAQERLGRAP